jgi:hypothetical protein
MTRGIHTTTVSRYVAGSYWKRVALRQNPENVKINESPKCGSTTMHMRSTILQRCGAISLASG